MRVISKQVLIEKLNGDTYPYISKLKLMFLLTLYGYNIEIKEDNNEPNE